MSDKQTMWQPIATAPDDRPHIRGLWVYTPEGKLSHFECHAGIVDGYKFGDVFYNDSGWPAADFDYWCELPPIPLFPTNGTPNNRGAGV